MTYFVCVDLLRSEVEPSPNLPYKWTASVEPIRSFNFGWSTETLSGESGRSMSIKIGFEEIEVPELVLPTAVNFERPGLASAGAVAEN
jgi:hypothetical protein